MAEKARRWTLTRLVRDGGDAEWWRVGAEGWSPTKGDDAEPGSWENVEVAEVSALRAEWEAELLNGDAISEAAYHCKAPIDGDELHEAVVALLKGVKDQPA